MDGSVSQMNVRSAKSHLDVGAQPARLARSYFGSLTCSRDALYVPNFFAIGFSVG